LLKCRTYSLNSREAAIHITVATTLPGTRNLLK
jgi:hypothetical protein